jgi:hypothetical protein
VLRKNSAFTGKPRTRSTECVIAVAKYSNRNSYLGIAYLVRAMGEARDAYSS